MRQIAKKEFKKCSCCGESKLLSEFYKSNSNMYKADKLLPLCKECLFEVYEENFQFYKNPEDALYKTIMGIDCYYDLKTAKKAVIEAYGTDKNIMKCYMSQIGLKNKNLTAKSSPYRNIFDNEENKEKAFEIEKLEVDDNPFLITKEMIERWGEGLEIKDYMFLQEKYDTMCATYGSKNPSSLWIYEQIALNFLDIKKERERPSSNSKDSYNKIKTLQETNSKLMTDAKMKEAQTTETDEDNMRFSKFIEMIEDYEPIPKSLKYDDYDNIHKVWKEDFVSPFAISMGLESNEEYLKMKRQGKIIGDNDELNEDN